MSGLCFEPSWALLPKHKTPDACHKSQLSGTGMHYGLLLLLIIDGDDQ